MTTIQPGNRLADRYRIEAVLATGGMGAVYRAIDERLARPVAVKVLLAELAADATQIARFEREAMASARLSHPGIVQVHDFGKTDQGLAYLVMELINGQTLASHLDAARLAPSRAVDIGDQALAALSAAHAAGIVHRDLKPANLMIVPLGGGREHVKILDFGIAQLKTGDAYMRLTATGDIVGTPSFMAPEQARSEPADARTDVYAMGMVLWCALTGKKPWANQHVAQMVIAVQTEMPTRADLVTADVPKSVALAVEKAIAKRPEDRFASADEFAQALSRAKNAITPETRAPLPATSANPFKGIATPAPVRTPAPVEPLSPALPPRSSPMAMPVAHPATPTPPPKKPRWWLRILVAITLLGILLVIVAIAAVLGLGMLGYAAFASLPNAQHPAVGSLDPTCIAAERCCRLADGDEAECASYALPPYDLESCRAAIGSYGDQIAQSGGDASSCSPYYAQ